MTLFGWFSLLFLAGSLNMVISIILVRDFLSRTPSIGNAQDLESFKQEVRRQMYMALVQLGLMIMMLMLSVYGVATGQLSLGIVLIYNGLMIGMSKFAKHHETRARSMAVNDENLSSAYQAICQSWLDEPIPRF